MHLMMFTCISVHDNSENRFILFLSHEKFRLRFIIHGGFGTSLPWSQSVEDNCYEYIVFFFVFFFLSEWNREMNSRRHGGPTRQ